MLLFLVFGFSLTLLHCSEGGQLTCFACFSVDDPRKCNTTARCQVNEQCIVTETIDNDFKIKYQLGCAEKTLCQIRRERRHKRSLSQQCCTEDLCNRGFPGTLSAGKITATTTTATPSTTTPFRTLASTAETRTTTLSIRPSTSEHTSHHHHHNHHADSGCRMENWIRYKGYFFYSSELHSRQRLQRNEAMKACEQCNMTLLSIHSAEEQAFVHMNLTQKNEIWLGLQHNVWLDGSPLDYSNWRNGEHTPYLCIVMDTNQQWHPEHCDRSHLFVCKRPADQ